MKPVFAKVLDGIQEEVYLTRSIERPFFSTEFRDFVVLKEDEEALE